MTQKVPETERQMVVLITTLTNLDSAKDLRISLKPNAVKAAEKEIRG